MIGIATPSAQALANSSSKIPIILGAVTDPKGAGLVTNNTNPGGNVTGVSDQAPLAEQLSLIRRVMPHLKTLGIIYTSSMIQQLNSTNSLKCFAKRQEFH